MRETLPFATHKVFIGGRWRAASGGQTLPLANPSDGGTLTEIARGGAADVDAAVAAAQAALDGDWGRLTAAERGRLLAAMGRKVLEHVDELARLEALDVGKPLKQGRADAVRKALVKRGVADKTFDSIGYGSEQPIADNDTDEGRAKNRRVEFHIVKTKGSPAIPATPPGDATPPPSATPRPDAPAPTGAAQVPEPVPRAT